MNANGKQPPFENPLCLLAHGGFFEVWDEAPTWTFEAEGSDAGYSMVYDGQAEPRLSVELDGHIVVIDVQTCEVLEGMIEEGELAYALAILGANAQELSDWWRNTHERIEAVKERMRELASGLTDLNDIAEDQD